MGGGKSPEHKCLYLLATRLARSLNYDFTGGLVLPGRTPCHQNIVGGQ